LPTWGGHTWGFRQKTIPDRREFDKLEIQVPGNGQLLPDCTKGHLMHQAGTQGGDLDKNVVSRAGI